MRRKPGTLFPIEVSILAAGVDLVRAGEVEFHGYAIARAISEREEARRLTAHGTLYRALDRMEDAGLLTSVLEDADVAAENNRPRRHLYRVTALGERALVAARPDSVPAGALRKGANPA